MSKKKQLDGLNYQNAQKRNSEIFNSLPKSEQQKLRQKGYKNKGWKSVIKSWELLQNNMSKKTINLIDFAINKAEDKYEKSKESNDVLEVLEAGKNLIKTLKTKYQ